MSSPRSFRLSDDQINRLNDLAARTSGGSVAAVGVQLIEEGLRMEAHPGVVFRDGPSGRRPVLAGGPDVWEVIRALRATRAAEPGLTESQLVAAVAEHGGVSEGLVRVAVNYWAAFAGEINDWIDSAVDTERRLRAEWERSQEMLAG